MHLFDNWNDSSKLCTWLYCHPIVVCFFFLSGKPNVFILLLFTFSLFIFLFSGLCFDYLRLNRYVYELYSSIVFFNRMRTRANMTKPLHSSDWIVRPAQRVEFLLFVAPFLLIVVCGSAIVRFHCFSFTISGDLFSICVVKQWRTLSFLLLP